MKNNLQINYKLAFQCQVKIIMTVVHGTNVNLLLFDIPEKGRQGEKSHIESSSALIGCCVCPGQRTRFWINFFLR